MIIATDSTGKVLGSYIDGTFIVTLTGVQNPPNPPEPQMGKNTELYYNQSENVLEWRYVDRPLTQAEQIAQEQSSLLSLQAAVATALGV